MSLVGKAAGAVKKGVKAVGGTAWGMAEAGISVGDKLAISAAATAKDAAINLPDKVIGGVKKVGNALWNSLDGDTGYTNPIGRAVTALKDSGSILDKFGGYRHASETFDKASGKMIKKEGGLYLTGLGKSALFGGGILAAAPGAIRESVAKRQGTIDDEAASATPKMKAREYSSSVDDGGATGDLVFALRANRFG